MGNSSSQNSNELFSFYKSKIKLNEKELEKIDINEKHEEIVYNKIYSYLKSFNQKERFEIKRNFQLKYGFKFDIKILSKII